MSQCLTSKSVPPFGDAPLIMGIVNVTPDSFSDGGEFYNKDKAIEHGITLLEQGAHILDIGGESTRPGAQVIGIQEEIDRVCPVIEGLSKITSHISVDTRNAETMRAALKAGASSINDVSGLTHDPESIEVAASTDVPLFIMHMQGDPQVMQNNPSYENVVNEVFQYLQCSISLLKTKHIEIDRIILDVGIGFGKTLEHNLLLLRNIKKFHDLGCPLLLGTSRKSFIPALSNGEPADKRLAGSLSSALWGLSQGVQIFRVHDVAETAQAFKIYEAIESCAES